MLGVIVLFSFMNLFNLIIFIYKGELSYYMIDWKWIILFLSDIIGKFEWLNYLIICLC